MCFPTCKIPRERTYSFRAVRVLKESTILILFAIVSPFVPFLLIGLALIQPINAYTHQVGMSMMSTPQGNEGVFVMDISNYARAQLVHGLFAGFTSGVMFAVAIVKWFDERRSDKIMPISGNVSSA